MAQRIVARPVCEAMEPRRYLSVGFSSLNFLSVNGAVAPIDEETFTSNPDIIDLAVATSNSVQILLGDNTGAFTVGDSIALPSNPVSGKSFLPGDFSGSGTADIVLLSQSSAVLNGVSAQEGVITYETNNGSGNFTSGSTSVITDNNLGFLPINAAVGDFNGDGKDDLAVVGKPGTGSQLVLAILISNGNGTFTETADYNITGSNSSGSLSNELVLSGPLTNGNAGVLVEDSSSGSGNLDTFPGNGTGVLTPIAPVAINATFITAGRFTSSSDADLVAAYGDTITTLVGNGAGVFTPQPPQTVNGTINALAGSDFDGDGKRDIVTNLGVQLGNGDGTFQSPIPLPALGGGAVFANTIVAGNVSDDGIPDIVGFSSAGNTIVSALNSSAAVASTIGVASNDNPANLGDDVQFTATVSSQLSSAPSGTVEFFDGSTELGSATLVNASATFDAGTGLADGSHSITALYNGDSNYGPSNSAALTQSVLAPSTTIVTSDENPSKLGDDVTFTAHVSGDVGNSEVPTGLVEFSDGNSGFIGSAQVDANGDATFDTASLSIGLHTIDANYFGDANFSSSETTVAVSQTVIEPALVPSVPSTTLPTDLVSDRPASGKAIVHLTNETASAITGPIIIKFFAAQNGIVNSSTPLITSEVVQKVKIEAMQFLSVVVPIKTSSFPATAGTYTLLAQVSYNNGTTANATTGPNLAVDSPFIELIPTLTLRQLPAVVLSESKTRAVATVSIRNNGNIPSVGPVTIAISASTVTNVPGTPIVSITKTLLIKPDAISTVTIPLKSIPLLVDGDYFIVAQTTDPDNGVNVVSSPSTVKMAVPLVALSTSIGSVTPISVARGKSVSFAVTITNNGNIATMGPANFDLGVSTDGETVAASLIDLVRAVTLTPGASKAVVLTFKIPSTATAGSFFPTVSVSQNSKSASDISLTQFTIV